VPLSIINKNIVEEFKSLISEISHTKHTKQQDYAIVTMACKTAIKAGEKLSNFEMNKLVEDLFETENPFTCPHGRPIIFKMNKEDIYRKFQR
jgi:DNA mismatch repair protein MutL